MKNENVSVSTQPRFKQFIIRALKSLSLYPSVKRVKDGLFTILRERLSFNQDMLKLYTSFVKEGDLCFDVGAALGNRTNIFLKLGARKVVAVEPLPYHIKKLVKRYSGNHRVSIEKMGLGDKKTQADFFISPSATFLSTFDKDMVKDVKSNPQMKNVEWKGVEKVNIDTLDNLIKKYGAPDFVKIDVEGFEPLVFKGLSCPIKKLSFEYQPRFMNRAIFCIKRLNRLGKYKFNYSIRESMRLSSDKWLSSKEMIALLKDIPESIYFGDVYAKLAD